MNTIDKLEKLADLKETLEIQQFKLDVQKQAMIEAVYTDEIKKKIAEIEAEFKPKYDVLGRTVAIADALEGEIRQEVLVAGETIKASRLQMVWVKGRESWDTKGLTGYAIDHPELEQFHKIGEPSTTLRKVV